MKKVPVNKVREQLSKYLTEAEHGEEVIITRHNKPVAKLVNYEDSEKNKEKGKKKFPDMTEFRNKIKVKGKPMSEFVVDMRREERY